MNKDSVRNTQVRNKYTPQFKDQAVERAAKDGVPQVAKSRHLRIDALLLESSKKVEVVIQLKTKRLIVSVRRTPLLRIP